VERSGGDVVPFSRVRARRIQIWRRSVPDERPRRDALRGLSQLMGRDSPRASRCNEKRPQTCSGAVRLACMQTSEAVIPKLISAFNEGNEVLRREQLAKIWTEDGAMFENGVLLAKSRAELERRIAGERADPHFSVNLVSSGGRNDGLEWGRWRVRRLQRPAELQDLLAQLSSDGQVTELKAATAVASRESGKLTTRLQEAAIANPVPTIGLLGGTLYLALRIPVGLFYGDLGVTPDEVGFGPQVLVPQSLTLLVAFLLVMLSLWALGYMAMPVARVLEAASRLRRQGQVGKGWAVTGIVGFGGICGFAGAVIAGSTVNGLSIVEAQFFPFLPLLLVGLGAMLGAVGASGITGLAPELRELRDQGRRARVGGDRVKVFVLLTAIYGAIGLLIGLPIWALIDADAVRSGDTAGGRMTPWRALPVELRWNKKGPHPQLKNKCDSLRLLGEGNGELVLFDTDLDKVFRVPVTDAAASVTRTCPKSASSRAMPPVAGPTIPDPRLESLRLGSDGSFLISLPPFSKDVTGVASLMTRDVVPMEGTPGRSRRVAIATQAFQGRRRQRVRLRIRLSPFMRRLVDRREVVPIRLDMAALDGSGNTARRSSCFSLAAERSDARAGAKC
jgi:hypothetical protein